MRRIMLCCQYQKRKNDKVIFCGRLADYKYYDMHVVIERALEVVEKNLLNDRRKIDIVVLWVDGSDPEFIARNKP